MDFDLLRSSWQASGMVKQAKQSSYQRTLTVLSRVEAAVNSHGFAAQGNLQLSSLLNAGVLRTLKRVSNDSSLQWELKLWNSAWNLEGCLCRKGEGDAAMWHWPAAVCDKAWCLASRAGIVFLFHIFNLHYNFLRGLYCHFGHFELIVWESCVLCSNMSEVSYDHVILLTCVFPFQSALGSFDQIRFP